MHLAINTVTQRQVAVKLIPHGKVDTNTAREVRTMLRGVYAMGRTVVTETELDCITVLVGQARSVVMVRVCR